MLRPEQLFEFQSSFNMVNDNFSFLSIAVLIDVTPSF